MRAGKLRHRIALIGERRKQSPSGFVSMERFVLMRCFAHVVKRLQSYDKDGISAREAFDGETITFQIRNCQLVKAANEVEYEGETYHVSLSQPAAGNTVLLTCKKQNK